ncbi:hypothetical protein RA307_06330 [Xanthobacteraceae bacterium Astr-EGSB]|uniref:hypothetical protein n=1 Tax=Astrobacterium formosum TaxID=3069710 RepID=UPI0027B5C90E|nr:hypothetical protein [Xanthobacteraceae bacterium Astr-EGSB]
MNIETPRKILEHGAGRPSRPVLVAGVDGIDAAGKRFFERALAFGLVALAEPFDIARRADQNPWQGAQHADEAGRNRAEPSSYLHKPFSLC